LLGINRAGIKQYDYHLQQKNYYQIFSLLHFSTFKNL